MKRGKVKEGDIVNVLRIGAFEGTIKIPGRVIAVLPGSFAVEAIRQPFDEEGHTRLWLNKRMKGHTWE